MIEQEPQDNTDAGLEEVDLGVDINSLSSEDLHRLEQSLIGKLGEDEYRYLVDQAIALTVHIAGTGDIPPGYDPDKDPILKRRVEVSRKVVIATLASALGVATIGATVYKYKGHKKRRF